MLPDEIKIGDSLTMFDYVTWFNLVDTETEDVIEISNQELANIPQVKALIDVLKYTEFSNEDKDTATDLCPYCERPSYEGHKEKCRIKLALDAFKCLPDDR